MINTKMLNDEVFVAEDRIVKINRSEMDRWVEQAKRNPRGRARLCAHKDTQDRLHEMFIVMARDIYVRPHKHLNKTESFHVIDGSATVVFFDECGGMEEIVRIGDFQPGAFFYFRNDESSYHTQIITSDYLVVHEITTGPFNRTDTVFAPWAPSEEDPAAVKEYMEKLKRDVAVFRPH